MSRAGLVVLGGDVGAYGLARAFREAYGGSAVVVSTVPTVPLRYSRVVENVVVPRMGDREDLLTALRRVADRDRGRPLLLLGTADWHVRTLVALRESGALPPKYVVPYVPGDLLDRGTSKVAFAELCAAHGVPHPATVVHDLTSPQPPDVGGLTFPLVAKPEDATSYHAVEFPGKKKVYTVGSEAGLRAVLDRVRAGGYRASFVIQERVPGDDTGMRVLTTYSDRAGRVRFASFGQVLLEEHTPGALGNPVAIITTHDDEVVAHATRLLEGIGWTGFANFDLKVDPRDGRTVFFELNPRLGRSHYYVTAAGRNTLEMYVREYVEGRRTRRRGHVAAAGAPDPARPGRGRPALRAVAAPAGAHPGAPPRRTDDQPDVVARRARPTALGRGRARPAEPRPQVPAGPPVAPGGRGRAVTAAARGPRPVGGVLGGLGPAATVHFLSRVVALTEAARDQDHVDLAVLQHATVPDRTAFILGRSTADPTPALVADVRRLERLGVSLVAMPCNTASSFLPALRAVASVPVLSIVEEALGLVSRTMPDARRIGVLSTEGTVASALYPSAAEALGLEVVPMDADDAARVRAIIYDQVKAGRSADLAALRQLVARSVRRGADVVVLGCTELSVAAAGGLAAGGRAPVDLAPGGLAPVGPAPGGLVPRGLAPGAGQVVDALDALAAAVVRRAGRRLRGDPATA